MNSYRFSPILSEERLIEAVKYVAMQTSILAEKIVGQSFPIVSLTIFSHDQKEYDQLTQILNQLGSFYNENNGPRVTLYKSVEVGQNRITHLRIRKPDIERPQVGCNDFVVNYEDFKSKYLELHLENLKLIKRPEYEMIEIRHPDFDVLAYVVSK